MQLDRYRKVSCQVWLDQKFLSLSDDAKLVFLLILTHPNLSSFGAMKVSPASLTDELGWLTERLSTAFQEVLANGFAKYDQRARLLVLSNFMKHNKPASPNVVKSWVGGYKELPECELKDELFHQLKDYAEGLTEGFQEAFGKAFGKAVVKAVGIQRAESIEQGTEIKPIKLSSSANAADPCPHASIIELYHAILPMMPAVKDWNAQRQSKLRARWREDSDRQSLDWWKEFFTDVSNSDFLCGRVSGRDGSAPFMASLEWLITPNKFAKVIEGNYRSRSPIAMPAKPVDSWAGRDIP